MSVYYDPYDIGIVADPYPAYAALRDEAPLYYNERYDFWALSRHADVEAGQHVAQRRRPPLRVDHPGGERDVRDEHADRSQHAQHVQAEGPGGGAGCRGLTRDGCGCAHDHPAVAHDTPPPPDAVPLPPPGGPRHVVEAPPVCRECGVIEHIEAIQQKGEGSGIGAVGGAILGGVLGHQVGEGSGKKLARIGGEEFAALLSGASTAHMLDVAESVRHAVETMDVEVLGRRISVTMSGGVSDGLAELGFSELFSCADRALYLAKAGGRNRIVHARQLADLLPDASHRSDEASEPVASLRSA